MFTIPFSLALLILVLNVKLFTGTRPDRSCCKLDGAVWPIFKSHVKREIQRLERFHRRALEGHVAHAFRRPSRHGDRPPDNRATHSAHVVHRR